MIEAYLQNNYSNQEAIQIFIDQTRQEDGIVAVASVQTHPKRRKKKYYLGKNKKVLDIEYQALKNRAKNLERKETINRKIMFTVNSQVAISKILIQVQELAQLLTIVFRRTVERLLLKEYKVKVLWTLSHIRFK